MAGLGDWRCGRCGAENTSADRFCGGCGAAPSIEPTAATGQSPPDPSATMRCPHCGGLNYSDALFCATCGSSLSAARQFAADEGCGPAYAAPTATFPETAAGPSAEDKSRSGWSIALFAVLALLVIGAAVGAAAWVLLSGDDPGGDVAAVTSPQPEASATDATAAPTASPTADSDAELLEFATALEDLMYKSGEGRQDIIDAVNGFSAGTMSVSKAAGLIQGVIDNRNAVLDELAALSLPAEQNADEMVRSFRKGIEFSVEADEYYLDWVYGSDAAYDKAGDAGTKAGRWKSDFVESYNPMARRLGLRHDWRQLDI